MVLYKIIHDIRTVLSMIIKDNPLDIIQDYKG